MSEFKVTGTVRTVKEAEQVSEKFVKREMVIQTLGEMYPQDLIFQTVQDKISLLDSVKEGDTVDVSFNLRGREWTNPQGEAKYFTTLEAWRIENTTNVDAKDEMVTNDNDLPF